VTRSRTLLAAALAALVLAPPAASSVQIRGLDTSAFPAVKLTVVSSKPVEIKPALAENGRAVVGLDAENLGKAKAVVLALDRSQSMSGRSLANALAAARTFLRTKAPGDELGLIVFGSSATQESSLSSSTADISGALGGVKVDLHSGTALYDAVVQAAGVVRSSSFGGRVIVLLTDGRNVTSGGASLDDAVSAARKAGAIVYAVGINGPQFDSAPLKMLASETGGRYVLATSSKRLGDIYQGIASELSRSWRVSYMSSAEPGTKVTVQASLVGAGSGRVSIAVPSTGSGAGQGFLPSFVFSTAGTIFVGLIIALIALIVLRQVATARKGSWVQARLAPHIGAAKKKKGVGTRDRLSAVAALFRATEDVFGNLNYWQRLTLMLERAGLPLKTVELVWTMTGVGIGLGLIFSLLGAGTIPVLLAIVVGGALPYGFVWFRMRRRLDAFENQLPDLLVTMAASLKAGHSFKQGLQAAMEEGQEPASDEFRRVLTQSSLGRPVDEALKEMSDRLGSANFEFVITAVTIQRQVGGSLAQLFDMVADTVRQRQQFSRKVRSLTAMGRLSATVLVGLPFFLAAVLTVINPSYMSPLYHTHAGNVLIVLGLCSMAVGAFLLRKVVSFKG
jgi:tight adherence protein B